MPVIPRYATVSSKTDIQRVGMSTAQRFAQWLQRVHPGYGVYAESDRVHVQGEDPKSMVRKFQPMLEKLSQQTATPITTKVTGIDQVQIDFTATKRDPMYGYAGGHTPWTPVLAAEAEYGSDPRLHDARTDGHARFAGRGARGARRAVAKQRHGTKAAAQAARFGYAGGHTPMDNILAAEEEYGAVDPFITSEAWGIESTIHRADLFGARGAIGGYDDLGDRIADEMFGGKKRKAARKARRAEIKAAKAALAEARATTVPEHMDALGYGALGSPSLAEEEMYAALTSPSLAAEEEYGRRWGRPRGPFQRAIRHVRRQRRMDSPGFQKRHTFDEDKNRWVPTSETLQRRADRRQQRSDWHAEQGHDRRAKFWAKGAEHASSRQAQMYGGDSPFALEFDALAADPRAKRIRKDMAADPKYADYVRNLPQEHAKIRAQEAARQRAAVADAREEKAVLAEEAKIEAEFGGGLEREMDFRVIPQFGRARPFQRMRRRRQHRRDLREQQGRTNPWRRLRRKAHLSE
jgi:hypothetical protein